MLPAFVLWCGVVYFTSAVPFTQAIQCQGTAKYTLTFKAEWTSQSHPNFPSGSNPHFSALVGCSHKADYVMWKPGIIATTGVKNVAEFGTTGALNNEMDSQINSKNAFMRYQGSTASNTGTTTITNIAVNSKFPLVSFITMIAPSPDWFVGVHDFNLCNTTTGKWLDSRKRDLPPYDAGTDSDTTFKHSGTPTMPRETIHLITNNTEGSLKSDKPLRRFGTFTFQKTYESRPTTTLTASASVQMTPTFTTTSAACSVKQHGFLHIVFAIIVVKLFL